MNLKESFEELLDGDNIIFHILFLILLGFIIF